MQAKRVLPGKAIVVVAANQDDVVDAVLGPFNVEDEDRVAGLAAAYEARHGGETKLRLLTSPAELES
jgi:hypothetical protein